MEYGIANISIIPIRAEKSERSEMISQILFGEMYKIIEKTEKWIFIECLHDFYSGWIDAKMCNIVSDNFAEIYKKANKKITTSPFNIIKDKNDYGNKLIVAGSIINISEEYGKIIIGDEKYSTIEVNTHLPYIDKRENILHIAMSYYNTPYLWGGRSHYGIDCSGLSQIVYKIIGINLPRDAHLQAEKGQYLSFLQEAKPGDLIFFGDNNKITHVGILWKGNKIIHSSGKVRIDNIDHQGIFNEEIGKYTHKLKLIRNILND